MLPDYYAILGIHPNASLEEVKQAFRLLVRKHHPDVAPGNPEATERFLTIHEAYQVLSSAELRLEYDQMRAHQQREEANIRSLIKRPDNTSLPGQGRHNAQSPAFHPTLELSCSLSQKSVPSHPDEYLLYVLSELIPAANGERINALPLNLCLAIDRSSSMRGEKLAAVRSALRSLIAHLQPGDIISIVAFDNRAEAIVRAEQQQFPDVLTSAVDRIIERGGTEIGWGLALALEEVRRFSRHPMVSHIILLTDGETYGDEQRCLELAQQAREHGIAITALGVGTEWNEQLLDQIASISDGTADYLASASDILTALEHRVSMLRKTLATNVKLSLTLEGGVRLRRVTRVVPDISDLMDAAPIDQRWMLAREAQLEVGNVAAASQNCALGLLWEVLLPPNSRGHYILGQMDLQYDIPSAKLLGQRRSERIAVDFVESAPPGGLGISPKVKQVIEIVTAYRIQNRAQELARQGDYKSASALLHTATLRLRAAAQEDLANEAQAQARLLTQQQTPTRAAALKLKYATKNLGSRQS
jgi:Ca-activated chloride channel family protein